MVIKERFNKIDAFSGAGADAACVVVASCLPLARDHERFQQYYLLFYTLLLKNQKMKKNKNLSLKKNTYSESRLTSLGGSFCDLQSLLRFRSYLFHIVIRMMSVCKLRSWCLYPELHKLDICKHALCEHEYHYCNKSVGSFPRVHTDSRAFFYQIVHGKVTIR